MELAAVSSSGAAQPEDSVLWDVAEEHLDEAEFLVGQFERMLEHPLLSLDDLAKGPESRLRAHVDGLVVGGPPVVERLLTPQLVDADPEAPARATAAALALIDAGRHDLLVPGLAADDARVRRATVRAAELVAGPVLERWALQRLNGSISAQERASLLLLIAKRGLAPPPLFEALQSDDAGLVAAAACAARHGESASYAGIIEHLLTHADAEVRETALVAALAWGSAEAWAACQRWALDAEAPHSLPMSLYAALGSPAQHTRLAQQLEHDSHRSDVLFALGFSGNPALVPLLLEHLRGDNPLHAKLAAQAIATITGLDLKDDAFAAPMAPTRDPTELPVPDQDPEAMQALPPLEADDLDADLAPAPEDALPTPNAEAIARFCEARASTFEPQHRYLGGKPFQPAIALAYLEPAPLRRRHVLALALGILSGGQLWLDTQGFSLHQRAQWSAARGLDMRTWVRHFARA